MGIKAKEVLKGKYWVLVDNDKQDRVGEMESTDHGYKIQFDHMPKNLSASSMADVQRQVAQLKFVKLKIKDDNIVQDKLCMGYPAKAKVYSPLWDMTLRVPVYLTAKNSKSWYAAGYYLIKFNRNWKIKYCPKVIALQRYTFRGPFKTKDELLQEVE